MKYNAVRKTTHSTDVVKIRKLTKSNISLNRSIEVDLLFVVITMYMVFTAKVIPVMVHVPVYFQLSWLSLI